MTYPYGTDPLDGLDATPAERLAYLRALDEVEAEEATGLPSEPEPGPYGPWDDLHAATAAMDRGYTTDAARAAEDEHDAALERRPSTETRIERALGRIARGSYTQAAQFQPARDAHGQFAPGACGDTGDLGYCTSRYHDPGCSSVIAGAAAAGSEAEAQAWRDTLERHTPDPGTLGYSAEFSAPSDPLGGTDAWADLLAPGPADPATVHQRMLAVLDGEQAAEPGPGPEREPLPDVAPLRSALGI